MTTNAIAAYRHNRITCATPGEVLIAMYDGAIRFVEQGRQAITQNDASAKGQALDGAIAILNQLSHTMNDAYAPELCGNLRSLYGYYVKRVLQSSASMQTEPLDEVIEHLQNLRTTWVEAVQRAARDGQETR